MECAITQIIGRQRQYEPKGYINFFRADDMKKLKDNKSEFYLTSLNIKKLKDKIDDLDAATYGIFMQINPLNKSRRRKEDISKIIYAFIDLDDASDEHNELIKANLKKFNITYSYNAKSGHGYHFLIPLELNPLEEDKIKSFLSYLKSNICDKVDVSTGDNGRLMRIPGSFHKKDKIEKQLKTLHSHIPKEKEIQTNNENIIKYQLEQKKGKCDIEYQKSINRNDVFFNNILTNQTNWTKYYKYLNQAELRNDRFVKNLAIFILSNKDLKVQANNFLNLWESSRIPAFEGWIKKAAENNMQVSYHELLKWSKEYSLTDFIKILEEQLKSSFLDKYEIYYLEDEKKENNTLLYYTEKNYFLQKSMQEVLINIYYECKASGTDLIKELNLIQMYEKWDTFGFNKQLSLIYDQLKRLIEQENRVKLVYNINYEPSDEKFVIHNKKKSFNTYTKTDLWDYYKKDKKYYFPKVEELIFNLCGEDKKSYNWFNKWLAYQVQNPKEKLPTAVILQGRQGSGKGTFKALVLDAIFGDNCQEINQTHLESSFNEYLMGKQIIVANEVMHNENRQTLPNVLKNLVTDPQITISRKFRKEIVCKNYTHWIFCTNSDNPIKIDEDDRRYSVFYSEKIRLGLGKEIRENIDKELKEYISYLKSIEVIFDEVSEPLSTAAKESIIELNKDSVSKFIEFMQQFSNLVELYSSLDGHLNNYNPIEFDDGKFIITDNFYLMYDKWCEKYKEKGKFNKQNFSKKLSLLKCKTKTKRKKGVFRMYSINELESLMVVNKNEN